MKAEIRKRSMEAQGQNPGVHPAPPGMPVPHRMPAPVPPHAIRPGHPPQQGHFPPGHHPPPHVQHMHRMQQGIISFLWCYLYISLHSVTWGLI